MDLISLSDDIAVKQVSPIFVILITDEFDERLYLVDNSIPRYLRVASTRYFSAYVFVFEV